MLLDESAVEFKALLTQNQYFQAKAHEAYELLLQSKEQQNQEQMQAQMQQTQQNQWACWSQANLWTQYKESVASNYEVCPSKHPIRHSQGWKLASGDRHFLEADWLPSSV